ncbi:PfkB family carbohydrate kinase [Streptomyces canus]|uniref:PfkB family carbohydrate kinase n=1 Tax=Streptomyces canus TaxID=58343 RepID=UPI0036DFD5BE
MTHIAVLGSTNTDLVVHVDKAPRRGETVTGREFRTIPGGKGANQAVAAARSGATVSMIGAIERTVEGPSGTAHIVVDDEGLIASADALLLQLEIPLAAVQPLPSELLAATDLLVPDEHEAATLTGRADPFAAGAARLDRVPRVEPLAVALGEERPIREATTWSAAAAALSVQREGGASASMPCRSEIEARYPS